MKLGARIFKTGLAVVLALMLGEFLNLPSPVFAAVAAYLPSNHPFIGPI